jgi:hypothetical protein
MFSSCITIKCKTSPVRSLTPILGRAVSPERLPSSAVEQRVLIDEQRLGGVLRALGQVDIASARGKYHFIMKIVGVGMKAILAPGEGGVRFV